MPVLNYNFPFTMDQSRDMLDIRQIVVSLHPTLIGPTTSINGVFLGPFYYYFNVIPYFLSGGDPASLVYWNILWYSIAPLAIFFAFYKKDKILSLALSSIFLMSTAFFYSARYFWSANPMPYVTTFYFLSLLLFIFKRDKKSSFLSGLIAGLSMQFEAAFGILFFPFLLVYSLFKKIPLKTIFPSFVGFFITLIPQILFEFRHGFIMSKTFISEVSGKSQILGEKLSFLEAQVSHIKSFIEFGNGAFTISDFISRILLVFAIAYLIINFKKLNELRREVFLTAILFLFFGLIFYSWYLHPLKGWYLLGLRIPYFLILAVFITEISTLRNLLLKAAILGFFVFSFVNTFIIHSQYIPENESVRSGDKSNLRNEIEAIDWVYTKAQTQGFKAYNYIPSVYDFPYQYLYWWYGTNKYGYQPETVTYLDNVPEYIKDNDQFYTKKKSAGDDPLVFLIYEKDDERPERLKAWLGSFTHLCSTQKQDYSWGTTVELRKKCN